METKVFKRVPIVVAKLGLAILFILAGSNICVSQTLEDSFSGSDGITYHFKEQNNFFKTVKPLHIGKEVAEGYYRIKNDTLYLRFKPVQIADSSSFKIIKKDSVTPNANDSDMLVVKFNVFDQKK